MANEKREPRVTERTRYLADDGADISYLAWRRGMAGQEVEVLHQRSAGSIQHA